MVVVKSLQVRKHSIHLPPAADTVQTYASSMLSRSSCMQRVSARPARVSAPLGPAARPVQRTVSVRAGGVELLAQLAAAGDVDAPIGVVIGGRSSVRYTALHSPLNFPPHRRCNHRDTRSHICYSRLPGPGCAVDAKHHNLTPAIAAQPHFCIALLTLTCPHSSGATSPLFPPRPRPRGCRQDIQRPGEAAAPEQSLTKEAN